MSAFRASSPGADLRDYLHRMPPARNPELAAAYECGRAETKAARSRGPLSVGEHLARQVRRFKPRRRPVSPDRLASRKRRFAAVLCGSVPAVVGSSYTPAQVAALAVIAGEVKRHGVCDLAVDAIAALAGCGRTSLQDAVREALKLGHLSVTPRPRPGQKNLTNLIQVIDRGWLAWIRRGPKRTALTGFKAPNPTNTPEITGSEKARFSGAEEALRWVNERRHAPPDPGWRPLSTTRER